MKKLLWLGFWSVSVFVLCGHADPRPNVIVIMVDDMGYSDIGCYGGEIKTPNLDKLAANGIRYTQAYNTSKCWTTRISLLTGVYHNRSTRGFAHTAMVSEVLGPAGYQTWWAGKHHADFNPRRRGFDHFKGFLGGAINFWNPGGKNARPGEPVPGWASEYTWAFDDEEVKPWIPPKTFFATDTFTDWSMEWVEQYKDSEQPFFLFLAHPAPHWPLHAHKEDIAKYEGVYDGGYAALRRARYKKQLKMGLFEKATTAFPDPDFGEDAWASLSPGQKAFQAKLMEVHAAMVDRVDQNVGRLVQQLKKYGKYDNTLILFLVDNGASAERSKTAEIKADYTWGQVGTFDAIGRNWAMACNTPMRYWKVTSHEGGVCTPMIAHWPKGIVKPGRINTTPCHLVDFLPTWMELAGPKAVYPGASQQADIPALDGQSIVPTFRGEVMKREKPMFFAYGKGRAVRLGDWKLVAQGAQKWELYNLAKDRTETNNLAGAHPERVMAMEKLYAQWQSESAEQPKGKKTKKK